MRSIRTSVLLLAAISPLAALGATTLPVSGISVAELAAFDDAMLEFMQAQGIEAGVLGVMKDGVVALERGYGWKDAAHTEVLPATAMMRIASVTKPITAAAPIRVGPFEPTTLWPGLVAPGCPPESAVVRLVGP